MFFGLLAASFFFLALYTAAIEFENSRIQARIFSRFASRMTFGLGPGRCSTPLKAPSGPHDIRLGYSKLKDISENLEKNRFVISRQACPSSDLLGFRQWGFFPVFHEKTEAGLKVYDRLGKEIFARKFPGRTFNTFSDIPPLVVKMLLYIENRDLLDEERPFLNPAIAWKRLAKAVFDQAVQVVVPGHSAVGGSTLATQTEKFRHSPEGITYTAADKIQQMISASLRSYLDGEKTLESRKRIVLDYINSIPLAARPGYGEINGLGDGLWAWYGVELEDVAKRLREIESSPDGDPDGLKSKSLKQILSLFLAHRRPTDYLLKQPGNLEILCEKYLRRFAAEGIFPESICRSALDQRLSWRPLPLPSPRMTLPEKKSANAVRTHLLSLSGVNTLYDLDRMDLTVRSSLDLPTQTAVTRELVRLRDGAYVREKGLTGPRLLEKGNPENVVYSFTLYEKTPHGNVIRVQTDNYDQPLNINEGVKLDLGSTAKLRTLTTYLEIISSLFDRYGGTSRRDLLAMSIPPRDALTAWAVSYLVATEDRDLYRMLNAAMERTYSGNPGQSFFTGGGIHYFENFDDLDDHRILTVREGLKRSVNLVFIRLMKDVVRYFIYNPITGPGWILQYPDHPQRKSYLEKFADMEGSKFVRMFYRKYAGKSPDLILSEILELAHQVPARLAYACRFVDPGMDIETFSELLRKRLGEPYPDHKTISKLYHQSDPERFTLSDRGYLSRIHPLELWVASYLRQHRDSKLLEVLSESASTRQDVYRWLFRTSRKSAQNQRIYTLLELDAFAQIHQEWEQLGYPFGSLVPSLATAIGSSGDRPASLADLMGIFINNGIRMPSHRIETLHFAEGTPYEVFFEREVPKEKLVINSEIARVIREALCQVVESGTARRVYGSFTRKDGSIIPLGGKTGTGDHRYETFGAGGRLISSRVVNRTSTFAFFLGDRFFGVALAYVAGPEADSYAFTSSLPVSVLKLLSPQLTPLVTGESN